MSNVSALLLLSFAACSTAEAGGGDTIDTAYDCEGIVANAQTPSIDPKLVAPWHELVNQPTVTVPWALRAQRLARSRLPTLSLRGTIYLQHQMLLVAQRLDQARRNNPIFHPAHQAVMDRILATAPPKEAFAALGAGSHPDLLGILGPRPQIIERATSTCGSGNSVHARAFQGLLAFRPLRTETDRALVAQIVAFDNEGMPHITPLVDGIELRRGFTPEAPACVVQARSDGTLHVAAHEEIEQHRPFVEKHGAGLTCNRCHRTGRDVGARDLHLAHDIAKVDLLRDTQVENLASRLWNSFEWKLERGTPPAVRTMVPSAP